MVPQKLDMHGGEKMEDNPYLMAYTKINSKWTMY